MQGEKNDASTQLHVQPRYNEGPRDWQNMFALTKFRCVEVFSHTLYYNWARKIVCYTWNFVTYRGSLNRDSTVDSFPSPFVIWSITLQMARIASIFSCFTFLEIVWQNGHETRSFSH